MNESSEVASIDPDNNPRYVGKNPNNYVKFNDELWRIIGVFNGQAKIIRNNELQSTGIEWDKNSANGGHGKYGYNDWSISTLKMELNGNYLNGIEEKSRKIIDESHVWNLGGIPGSMSEMIIANRTNLYNYERGTSVYEGRSTTWTGAIGLMYASDYGYSTSATNSECDETMYNWEGSGNVENCMNNSWIKNSNSNAWVISPSSIDEQNVFIVSLAGGIDYNYANLYRIARPVLYLKPNVKITSGNGSAESPFLLEYVES